MRTNHRFRPLPALITTCSAALACEAPLDTEPELGDTLVSVSHVLVADGRRVGQWTADSAMVLDHGNRMRAWNAVVMPSRGPVEVRADSMTVDWRAHEMRYHGAVDIVSGDRTLRAEDVVLAEW